MRHEGRGDDEPREMKMIFDIQEMEEIDETSQRKRKRWAKSKYIKIQPKDIEYCREIQTR